MSKEEIRALVISKLRPSKDNVIYDIGAGTGGLTVEAALIACEGRVFSVEKDPEAVDLIRQNLVRFDLDNVKVIQGEASDAVDNLPKPDRVIIGGSGGWLEKIIETVDRKLISGSRLVVPAITLETLETATDKLETLGYDVEIVNVSVTRTRVIGDYHMFNGMNPVYVISAEKEESR